MSNVTREMARPSGNSPAARSVRRRSFNRRSLSLGEPAAHSLNVDKESRARAVSVIFQVANEAMHQVSKDLNIPHDEVVMMKRKLHSLEEVISSRSEPLANMMKTIKAFNDNLCPPKRQKTETAEEAYLRDLQRTLDDWNVSKVQVTLSKMTTLEPFPLEDEPTDEASSFQTQDVLGTELQNMQNVLAAEAEHDTNTYNDSLNYVDSLLKTLRNNSFSAREIHNQFKNMAIS